MAALNAQKIGDELAGLLETNAIEGGASLRADAKAVAAYASERLAHLKSISGQAGFREAVKAEADNIALFAAKRAIDAGKAIDARIVGIIDGALTIGLKAL